MNLPFLSKGNEENTPEDEEKNDEEEEVEEEKGDEVEDYPPAGNWHFFESLISAGFVSELTNFEMFYLNVFKYHHPNNLFSGEMDETVTDLDLEVKGEALLPPPPPPIEVPSEVTSLTRTVDNGMELKTRNKTIHRVESHK